MERIFTAIYIAGFSSAGASHIIGIYLLFKVKNNIANQRVLTINLAFAEMLGSWYHVFDKVRTKDWDHVDAFFDTFIFPCIRWIVILIIIDRFLDIYLHIKYPVYITTRKLLATTFFVYGFSVIVALILTLLTHKDVISLEDQYKKLSFTILILDVAIIFIAVVTYIYLYSCVRRILQDSVAGKQTRERLWVKFMVPCLLVATHILFNATSSIIKTIFNVKTMSEKSQNLYVRIFGILDCLGWQSDAVIYIFLPKQIRTFLISSLGRAVCKVNRTGEHSLVEL